MVKSPFPEELLNILAKCLDDNESNMISLSIIENDKKFVDDTEKKSARTYATLVIIPEITLNEQKYVVEKFNRVLNDYRNRYNSLFLANYRESSNIHHKLVPPARTPSGQVYLTSARVRNIARKRLSFELMYRIVGNILSDMGKEQKIENMHISGESTIGANAQA